MKKTYQFDLTFQEYVLASMLGDQKFLVHKREVLKPEYFDDEILCSIAQAGADFFDKHKTLPDESSICEEIKNYKSPGRKYGEYKEQIRSIYAKIGVNTEYYQHHASDWARRQALIDAVNKAHEMIEVGDYDNVQGIIQNAVSVGTQYHDIVYDYFSESKARAIDYKNNKKERSTTRITTGVSQLDELTQGGLDKGELGVVVAPPKHGKSTALFNIGACAVMSNKVVLHVTLEMKKRMVAARYDSRFFGDTMDTIKKKPKSFYKAMQVLKAKFSNNLKIVEYPTKKLTIHGLKSIASRVENLGMIIVDYADLMKPSRRFDERRFELTEIYENLRGLAGELQVPIWTASQSSRSSVGAKLITMDFIAECFDKMSIVDLAIALCQTESEKRTGQMRIFIMANRLGESNEHIECEVDWKTAKIQSVIDADEEDEDEG